LRTWTIKNCVDAALLVLENISYLGVLFCKIPLHVRIRIPHLGGTSHQLDKNLGVACISLSVADRQLWKSAGEEMIQSQNTHVIHKSDNIFLLDPIKSMPSSVNAQWQGHCFRTPTWVKFSYNLDGWRWRWWRSRR
jgi:hypothetical protein